MRFSEYLNEEKEIPRGLLNWVITLISMRNFGNVKGAKAIKKDIDKDIKKLKLDSKKVYMYFGDPDSQQDKVKKNIEKFKKE